MKERYFNIPFDENENLPNLHWYVLVIYDIVDNKKRTKLAKLLNGYGFRVQKSAFEAILTKPKYQKLLQNLTHILGKDDDCRIYRIRGSGEVTIFGSGELLAAEDVVVL